MEGWRGGWKEYKWRGGWKEGKWWADRFWVEDKVKKIIKYKMWSK